MWAKREALQTISIWHLGRFARLCTDVYKCDLMGYHGNTWYNMVSFACSWFFDFDLLKAEYLINTFLHLYTMFPNLLTWALSTLWIWLNFAFLCGYYQLRVLFQWPGKWTLIIIHMFIIHIFRCWWSKSWPSPLRQLFTRSSVSRGTITISAVAIVAIGTWKT